MSPKHLKFISDPKWETKLKLPIELKRKVIMLIRAGKFEYFTDFAAEAIEEKLKREMRNFKYKGKRTGTNGAH